MSLFNNCVIRLSSPGATNLFAVAATLSLTVE